MTYARIQWAIVLIVFSIECIWIKFSSLKFYYSIKEFLIQLAFLMVFYIPYLIYKKFRPDPKIMIAFISIVFLQASSYIMLILSYLLASTNQPFVDSTLATMDSYMGFSSRDIVLMFEQHELLFNSFVIIYNSIYIQLYLIVLYFSFLGKSIYLERFLMQFIIAFLLTVLIAGLFPAAGPYVWYNYTPGPSLKSGLNHLLELRNNILDIRKYDGIVNLPSFHTILALLFTYTFRHERKIIFIPILILNLLVIFSCLPIGQHYLADIIAGAVVFAVTLGIEHLIYWGVKKNNESSGITFQGQIKQNFEIH